MSAALPARPCYFHGTAIVVGTCGILIRGRSSAGKSSLALAILRDGTRPEAALVGDDRVHVRRSGEGLIVEGHPAIAGRIEARGRGILTVPFRRQAPLRLLVDLPADPAERRWTAEPVAVTGGPPLQLPADGLLSLAFTPDVSLLQRHAAIIKAVARLQGMTA